MTAQELYVRTIGIMGITEANATTYAETIIPQINTVLGDCFKLENNNREYEGIALLTAIPVVTTLSDTITYQENLVINVLPYGIAQLLALSDDDTIRANYFGFKFAENYNKETKLIPVEVVDVFSFGEE